MSKCDCCKEENSNLITYKGYKMCPDCYMGFVSRVKVCKNNIEYETVIDQLKQQLAETEQEFLVFQEDSARNEQIYIRELAEKQNTIDKINKEFVQAVHDWKALCAEKDEEIEKLKLKLDIRAMSLRNINTERIESERNQTQLAISELEKVKDWLNEPFDEDGCFKIGGDLIDFIDQQINDLRGEKNAEG